MKTPVLCKQIVLSFILLLAAQVRGATTYYWTNSANANMNWSSSLNWSPNGVPGVADTAIFNSSNAFPTAGLTTVGGGVTAIALANFNNFVDSGFGGTISALSYSNTGVNFNNTYLNNGLILNVTNTTGFVAGSDSTDFGDSTSVTTIAGTNATLNVSNTNAIMYVGLGSATTSGQVATLDMSALQNFQAVVSRFMVALAYSSTTTENRPGGIVYLAENNTIVAEYQTGATETSGTVGTGAFIVGDTSSNAGVTDYVYFGQSNYISADTIIIGRDKCSATMAFNPIYAGFNPTVTIAGFTNSRVTTMSIGDGVVNTGTTTVTALSDFSLGTVNMQVITLYVGRTGATGTGGGVVTGTLNIGGGTVNVNTNYVGYQPTANTAGKKGVGTINVESSTAKLVVNNNLNIATCATAGDATGTLNITNGGTVWANNIVAGAGTSTITIDVGNLIITNTAGTAAAGLTTLNLENAIITLSAASGLAPIVATNVTADYSATDVTTFNITALPIITSFPTLVPLIQSPNSVSLQNGLSSFALGSLPAGYTGQIVLSGASQNLVELQVNSGPEQPAAWTGLDIPNHNTNWSDAANWSDGKSAATNTLVNFNSLGANSSTTSSALSTPGGGPAAIVASKLNNIVNGNFAVETLNYTNIGGTYENTSIAANDFLSISFGALTVGSPTLDFGNTTGNATISGPTATLDAANISGSFYVGLGTATGGSTPQATLDMSGLGTLISSNANLLVGVGGYSVGAYTVPQPSGVAYLAQTNLIYAGSAQPDNADTAPVALEVGDADTQAGLPSTLYLGSTNAIFADNISTARQLASGGIFFNPSVTSSSPAAYIRGYSASTVASWVIGDGAENATTTLASFGTNDFTGGSVNALVNNLYVGLNSAAVGASGQVTGTLNFNAGTINANNLNISYNNAASDGNVYVSSVGTATVSGTGLLVVNSTLNLDYVGGNQSYSGTPAGTFNITNGGTAWVNSIVPGANGGTSVINISGGTLILSNTAGTASAPLTSLNITNGDLVLAVPSSLSVFYTTSVNAGGGVNPIDILSLPPLASYPVSFSLIQSVNPLNQFNFALRTLPSGYTGSVTVSNNNTSVLLVINSGPISTRPFVIWDGSDSANSDNWSDRLNWELPGVPVTGDDIIFNNTDSVALPPFNAVGAGAGPGGLTSAYYINNVVDQNFNLTNLTYTNIGSSSGSPSFQNTYIDSGFTLTTSNFSVGTPSVDFGATASENVTIAGLGGTLNVNNTAGSVWVALTSASFPAPAATLDLSGLGTFNANVSTFAVGASTIQSGPDHFVGVLYLAETNTITATNSAVAETGQVETLSLMVGEGGVNGTTESYMYLGQMNTFNVNSIGVGLAKQTAAMQFNTGLTGTPLAVFRAADGVSPVSTWSVGDGLAQTGASSSPAGTADFSLGSVNALVSTMYLGRSPNASGPHPGTGVLNLAAGTFSVATLYDGYQSASDSDNGAGTINLDGPGTLVVSGTLYLAASTGSTGAPLTTGTINIGGGSVLVNTLSNDATGNSTIGLYGGTLAVSNSTGTLTSLYLSPSTSNNISATLQLQPANASVPAVSVGTLNIDGLPNTTNVINISVMPSITSYPIEIPLIRYTTLANAGSVFNVGLGSLPANGPVHYVGTLLNDTTSNQIALVLTSGPISQPLTWDGTVSANWNKTDANWRPASGPDIDYIDSDAVTFDDTLTSGHSAINLAANVFPNGVTFNNSATNTYTLTGLGGISGSTGLSVLGHGTVILDNSGANTFVGAVTITNGALQIGNNDGNGSLPGAVADNGSLIFNQTGSHTNNGQITGTGSVTDNGSGTLTLTVSNTFSGGLVLNNGTLQITATGGGGTPLGGALINTNTTASANVTINAGATLVGLGGDAFGYYPNRAPVNFFLNGGTITDSGTPNYRITLPNLTFNGGTLTSVAGTNNVSGYGNYTLYGSGAPTVTTLSNTSTVVISAGAVGLEGVGNATSTFNVASGHVTNGATPGVDLLITSAIVNYSTDVGGLTKTGAGVMEMTGTNLYTGPTVVSAGTLIMNGSLVAGSAATVGAAGTLQGTGVLSGALTVNGTIEPGSSSTLGTLTGGGNVTLNGTNVMKLNAATPANDVLSVAGKLAYGGTLLLTNLSGTLVAGDSFQLFNAASNSGTFASILPATPGAGLAWNTNNLVSGAISVVATAPPSPSRITAVSLAGGTLTISGTNGVPNGQYVVLTTTNLALAWTPVATNTISTNGNFTFTAAYTNSTQQRFYTIEEP